MTSSSKLRELLRRPVALARHIATVDRKASAVIEGMNNQSQLLNSKFEALIRAADNQSRLLSRLIHVSENQSRMMTERLKMVAAGLDYQSRVLNSKFDVMAAALHGLSGLSQPDVEPMQPDVEPMMPFAPRGDQASERPLLVGERTYNTSHPDYDVTVVRNFPGRILNAERACRNAVYDELKKLAEGNDVPDAAWTPVLEQTLAEVKSNPHADLIQRRRDATEQYMAALSDQYHAQYNPGWVNLDAALFLYWLVRKLQPKTIVQCGVCNGLSSAFMVLALTANGTEGSKLYGIDISPVFTPKAPAWTKAGQTYGQVIPEGKTSGWIVPEVYRKRFEVQEGDAKLLLPQIVQNLPTIDMFYHDSDHTYNHMTFEFREAKRKLVPGGLIVADDIAWNAALWDFADEHAAPAYNFKGDVGVTFF